jgi:hypothetical protein
MGIIEPESELAAKALLSLPAPLPQPSPVWFTERPVVFAENPCLTKASGGIWTLHLFDSHHAPRGRALRKESLVPKEVTSLCFATGFLSKRLLGLRIDALPVKLVD